MAQRREFNYSLKIQKQANEVSMSPMSQAMKMILPLITLIIIIGVALFISYKMGYGNFLGKLPFDIHYRSASTTIFIPLGTCVGLSLLYSLLKWFFARF